MSTKLMKALRKPSPAPGARVESIPTPQYGPSDVLIRVKTTSICGTDVHIYQWDRWSATRLKPPLTFGHEFCGVVESVGDNVTSVKPGEFVSAEMHLVCGHCRSCRMGQPHVCQNVVIVGIDRDGCFAEFIKIPETNIWKVDPAIPEHYAAILDPLGNAVHTVAAGPIGGLSVLITGAGPIGLMSIALTRAFGASKIYSLEINPHRRELAKRMGADEVFDPSTGDIVATMKEVTQGDGVDVLLEMSGNPTAIRQGFQILRPGGNARLLGIPAKPMEFDLGADVIFKGATVQGILGRRMYDTWIQMTDLLKTGRLNLDPLFNERMPMEKFADAFGMLEKGLAGKILLYPDGIPH